ncbi:eukaryotic peptide chain release factor subunit 1, partial [Teratosphaeria destructans]
PRWKDFAEAALAPTLHPLHPLTPSLFSSLTTERAQPLPTPAPAPPPPRDAHHVGLAVQRRREERRDLEGQEAHQEPRGARGNGTSMISLIIPPKDQVSRAAKMLAEEFGTASNIKSRVNRLSVLSAITSTQQRLKLYSKVPPNGLVVYCGEIITSEGKERKLNIDFEPFKPINTSLYLCDNKFHTEALSELLEADQKFGFIIMTATAPSSAPCPATPATVDLPKKHGRGGQSALRFARLREEKRHNYVRKVAELAVQNFITNDKVNVAGLILAGSADFKNDLNQSDLFDQRLQAKVVKVVDVSYGGENGFNQAIELSAETLSNVKFIQEKKLINSYFDEISQDTGKVCYGIDDTLKALEAGAAETLIVYENLEMTRWELKSSEGATVVLHTTRAQEANRELFMDRNTGQEMEVIDQMPFLEWLADKYRDFGATLEFVSDRSSEGNQFVRGFEGEAPAPGLMSDSGSTDSTALRAQHPGAAIAPASAATEAKDPPREDGETGREAVPAAGPAAPRSMVATRARTPSTGLRATLATRPKATLTLFPPTPTTTHTPHPTIPSIFTALHTHPTTPTHGLIPYENSTNGPVPTTLDNLHRHAPHLRITAETTLPVHHCLLTHPGVRLPEIRTLYSHPQAWANARGSWPP